jgi:hypothetical protein
MKTGLTYILGFIPRNNLFLENNKFISISSLLDSWFALYRTLDFFF